MIYWRYSRTRMKWIHERHEERTWSERLKPNYKQEKRSPKILPSFTGQISLTGIYCIHSLFFHTCLTWKNSKMYYVAAGVSRAELTKFDHHLWLHHHHLHQDHVDVSSSSGVRWSSSPFYFLASSLLSVCFSLSSSRSYHRSHHLASSPSPASKLMNMIMFPNTLYRQKTLRGEREHLEWKEFCNPVLVPRLQLLFFFQVTCQSLRSTHDVMRIQTPFKMKMISGERESVSVPVQKEEGKNILNHYEQHPKHTHC